MKSHIFREYDIRGIVGEDLDPMVTEAVGRAFASHVRADSGLDRPRIAVGHDNRASSPELASALISGLRAAGADVLDVGMVPTPVLYWAEVTFETAAAVQITGSHNPPEWNGIKMTCARSSLYGDAIKGILRRIESFLERVGRGKNGVDPRFGKVQSADGAKSQAANLTAFEITQVSNLSLAIRIL